MDLQEAGVFPLVPFSWFLFLIYLWVGEGKVRTEFCWVRQSPRQLWGGEAMVAFKGRHTASRVYNTGVSRVSEFPPQSVWM